MNNWQHQHNWSDFRNRFFPRFYPYYQQIYYIQPVVQDKYYYTQLIQLLDRYSNNVNSCPIDNNSGNIFYMMRSNLINQITDVINKISNITYRNSLLSQTSQLSQMSSDFYQACSSILRDQQMNLINQMKVQLASY